jgi:DNA polymerase III gamma/tau subunit
MLSPSELTARAETFGESDLVRLFHSLSDTESRLKDASQPRYMLEIGLVKLAEIRRLSSIESILERLAQLEGSSVEMPQAQKAAAVYESASPQTAPAEKKTLNSEEQQKTVVDEPAEIADIPEFKPDSTSKIDLEFIRSLPVRLPPIPSEELEHIEDPWLDDAYERKLLFSGDDLSPIDSVKSFVVGLVQEPSKGASPLTNFSSGTNASAAVAMALSETVESTTAANIEPPKLGADPTKEELAAYANAHPAVRAALKVFRGKLVRVTHIPSHS